MVPVVFLERGLFLLYFTKVVGIIQGRGLFLFDYTRVRMAYTRIYSIHAVNLKEMCFIVFDKISHLFCMCNKYDFPRHNL